MREYVGRPGTGPTKSDSGGQKSMSVTVSLVTHNGLKWLPGCLGSLRRQTLAPLEVLIVDNASSDGTLDWLRAAAARDGDLVLAESADNLGFAKAHNRNILRARGEFVCLLNQDVELDERFLEEATRAFSYGERIGAVQGRLRRLGPDGARLGSLDSTGLAIRRDRRVISRAQGERDGPQHATPGQVWGADGPAPVFRLAALLDARLKARAGGWEVLDEDFFMYKEDVDLAWRLNLLGWRAWYAPAALGWHARGTGGSGPTGRPGALSAFATVRAGRQIPSHVRQISWRNHRLMQIKNEQPGSYLRDLPWILRREVLSLALMLVGDWRQLRAIGLFMRDVPAALRKRRELQPRYADARAPLPWQ